MSEFPPFKLKHSFHSHEADVRGLCSFGNNLLSCSRDQTSRIWLQDESGGYNFSTQLGGHNGFVSSICYIKRSEEFLKGLIASASHDHSIRCYSFEVPEFLFQLNFHTSAVVSLAVSEFDNNVLLSTSWDKSAVVWDLHTKEPKHILYGHSQAVWCAQQLSNGLIITGSADHSIIISDKHGQYMKTLHGHNDCVRALCTTGPDCFLSAGNDNVINHWAAPSGILLWKLFTSDDYTYSMTKIPGINGFAWCGENGVLEIMRAYEVLTIKVPVVSVWSVCALENNDIAVGCSDGIIRIFSCDDAIADDGYKRSLALLPGPYPKLFRPYLNDLAGPEALLNSGKHEFDIRIVRWGLVAVLYSWESNNWQEIAKVMGTYVKQPKRNTHLKQGYDYVFKIKPTDICPEISLSLNLQDDVSAIATDVAQKNNIPNEYVSSIISSCIAGIKQDFMALHIPHLKSNEYITSFFPWTDFIVFESGPMKTICGKVKEFSQSEKAIEAYNLDSTLIDKVSNCDASKYISEPLSADLMINLLQWPVDLLLPILDLLRLAFLNNDFVKTFLSDPRGTDSLNKIYAALRDVNYPKNQQVILRGLSNMMKTGVGLSTIRESTPKVLKLLHSIQFPDNISAQLQIALVTFVLNLMISTEKYPTHRQEIFQYLIKLPRLLNDKLSVFRFLTAVGNFLSYEGSTKIPKDILNEVHGIYDRLETVPCLEKGLRELLLILRGYDNQVGDCYLS